MRGLSVRVVASGVLLQAELSGAVRAEECPREWLGVDVARVLFTRGLHKSDGVDLRAVGEGRVDVGGGLPIGTV